MRKRIIYLLCAILFCPTCFAYEYTEADKEEMYNSFIDGYMQGFEMQVASLPIDENKKAELRVYVQNMANKEQLINETWGCVQAVEPTDMMGLQNCFVPWAQRKGEELRNYIMSNFQSY